MGRHIHVHLHAGTFDAGEFNEADHPRAVNGQFSSGGGGSAGGAGSTPKPGESEAPKPSPERIKYAIGQVDFKAGRGGVPKSEVLVSSLIPSGLTEGAKQSRLMGSKQEQWDPDSGKVQTVKLRFLIGTQTSVRAERLKELLSDMDQIEGEGIQVMKGNDGKLYIVDGHHRVAAMSLLGERETEAIVYSEKKGKKA